MANVGRRRRDGESTLLYNSIVQDFTPPSAWTEDSDGHYLLIDLPGFKREEVKVQVDTLSGDITVSGERLTSENKYKIRFNQIFTLPPNSDIDKISGKFASGILSVTVAKQAKEEMEQLPVPESEAQSHFHGIDEEVVNRDGEDQANNQGENKEKYSKVDSFDEEFVREWGDEPSKFEWAIKMLKRNKGIFITALLAFSLGVLVSRKFGKDGHEDGAV